MDDKTAGLELKHTYGTCCTFVTFNHSLINSDCTLLPQSFYLCLQRSSPICHISVQLSCVEYSVYLCARSCLHGSGEIYKKWHEADRTGQEALIFLRFVDSPARVKTCPPTWCERRWATQLWLSDGTDRLGHVGHRLWRSRWKKKKETLRDCSGASMLIFFYFNVHCTWGRISLWC